LENGKFKYNETKWPQSHATSKIKFVEPGNPPPTMPRNTDPDTGLTRMTTRSKNATTHPGTMAQDALRVRRKKEEVAKEKELKNAQKEAKKEKRRADEARKAEGKVYIARLKAKEAAAAADMEQEIPHKRPVTRGWFCDLPFISTWMTDGLW
jgi:hypothetical protein